MSADHLAGVAERRTAQRRALLNAVHGEVMVLQPLTLHELSVGGLQIETAFPLQLDSVHDFRLLLASQVIVVKGRIASCRLTDLEHESVRYRCGVEFVDAPEHVRRAIVDFLALIDQAPVA
jgi:hypothetical protein